VTEVYRQRYRLPDALGGGEFAGTEDDGYVSIEIPGSGIVKFPTVLLTRIIPREPEDESWVTLARPDCWPQDVYSRHDTAAQSSGQPAEFHWWWHDEKRWVPWDAVYQRGTPVRLMRTWIGSGGFSGKSVRGICSVCKKPTPLRLDGMVKQHGRHRGCAGGNNPPLKEA
jgi:hypothetical protein